MKKLLVLGGTSASIGVINEAHELEEKVHVIVADDKPLDVGVAKPLADEVVQISTADTEALAKYVRENQVDGVFCGPTEFNIQNALAVAEAAGLPFYCTREQWDLCSNKASFKDLCRQYGVPCVPEFHLTEEMREEDLKKIRYPVIVKPVDGCSSKGLTVCRNEEELKKAYPLALSYSASKSVIVEKYLVGDYGVVFRYMAINGNIHLLAINDNYTVDTSEGKIMITAAAVFPSKRTKEFIETIHPNVVKMFEGIGVKNGAFFLQARVDGDDNQVYFHEMGLRLSGGLLYPIYKTACGYSDMKMMLRCALGMEMASSEEIGKIDPMFHGNIVGSLCVPLKAGTVGSVGGVDEIRQDETVMDVLQYYYPGESVAPEKIGTLTQHFCRIKFMTRAYEDIIGKVAFFQKTLDIRNTQGEDMIYKYFDTDRLQ